MIEELRESWGIESNKPKKDCKGMIFRFRINAYFQNNRYVYKEEMRLLKGKSCPGCDGCRFLGDDLNEFISNEVYPKVKNPVNEGLYKLVVTNISRDWESGIVDDWDLEFHEYKEEKGEEKKEDHGCKFCSHLAMCVCDD